MYEPRWYREQTQSELCSFTVNFAETDLWIGVNQAEYSKQLEVDCYNIAKDLYTELDTYIALDPGYKESLIPYSPKISCPPVAQEMALAALKAGVGPMAAVAGAFAAEVGKQLEIKYQLSDIIIENGGDIYLVTSQPRNIAIWAGSSVLSNKLALEILPGQSPLGICTSSGTVGHSLSFGKTDAVTILAKNAAVADAYATAAGNLVKTWQDIDSALAYVGSQPEIIGAVIIVGEHIGFCGDINLKKAQL